VRLKVVVVVVVFITLLYIALLPFPAGTHTCTRTSFSYHDPSLAFQHRFQAYGAAEADAEGAAEVAAEGAAEGAADADADAEGAADAVGLGTIETPLAMTLLGGADEEAAGATVLKERPETSAPASLGERVVVLANELALEFEFMPGLYELELDDEELFPLLPELPFLRMRLDIMSILISMKVSSGPATIALLCRSMTPPFKGWSSEVIQIATAPLRPCGTTHWLSGSEREKGMPAASIWQWKPCELVNTPV
jgi:hypothetical protein